jgi:hypothetical protein
MEHHRRATLTLEGDDPVTPPLFPPVMYSFTNHLDRPILQHVYFFSGEDGKITQRDHFER